MKSISKLKDEARRHEQREEWEKAIQAYLQVLRIADEGEAEVELPLFNRVGDLSVRLGKPQEAVRHYEQAADRYADAGLYNNAIALCNKALRYSPDRLELIRKLGQFSASQGFITDARRYFLDYAERQFNAGKVSEALSALEDFANVADDAEVREMLGRQLHAHGRTNEAVDELSRAYAMRVRHGETQQAEALQAEILAIDPKAAVGGDAPARLDSIRGQDSGDLPGLVEPGQPETETFTVDSIDDRKTAGIEGLERDTLPRTGNSTDADSIQLTGFETTGQPDLAEIDLSGGPNIEGLESTTLDFDVVDAGMPGLEDLAIERDDISFGDADGGPDAETLDLAALDKPAPPAKPPRPDEPVARHAVDGEAFDLPLLGDDEAADEEATPLPPPEIDGTAPLDLPEPSNFDLGGDLPLDLTSLGGPGFSAFDLPPTEDEAAEPTAWSNETFDLPEIDTESLGLPTWEPEPGPTFELPAFDTGTEADEPLVEGLGTESEDQEFGTLDPVTEAEPAADLPAFETVQPESEAVAPGIESPGLKPPAPLEPEPPPAEPEPASADRETASTGQEAIEVELEAADIELEAGAAELEAADVEREAATSEPVAAEVEGEAALPAAVKEVRARPIPEIPAIELPTWETAPLAGLTDEELEGSFEEPDSEALEPAWVDAAADEEEELLPDLPTFTYDDEDVSPEPTQSLDSDWLDDFAGDETADADVTTGAPPADDIALDSSTSAESGAGAGTPINADVEDTAEAVARADDAAREMKAAGKAPPARKDDGYIDLGALVAEDDRKETTRFRIRETAPTGDEDRDFAELLTQFKSKVHEHLPPEDAAAHYDLGLAFKEMGLLDEAIGEFQVALRAGHMRLKVYEELGQCFLQKEQFNIAQKVLSRALDMKFKDELELLGVYYHLGRAYEALGKRDQARDAYERVLGMDINFGDVTERLARL